MFQATCYHLLATFNVLLNVTSGGRSKTIILYFSPQMYDIVVCCNTKRVISHKLT